MSGRVERRHTQGSRDVAGAILSFAVEALVVIALVVIAILLAGLALWLV